MKNKKVFIIVLIVVIGALILSLGTCGKQENGAVKPTDKEEMQEDGIKNLANKEEKQADESQDVQVEEFEDELIIIPSTLSDSTTTDSTENSKTESVENEIVKDEEDNVQSTPEQEDKVESGIELGENELPFVPAE